MVKLAMTFIETFSDLELKLKLIQTLKEVTDKKIFLEVINYIIIKLNKYLKYNKL